MFNSTIFLMLRNSEIFQVLTEQELQVLTNAAQIKRYDKNVMLYTPGAQNSFVYFVHKGGVKLGQETACGKILLKDIAYEDSLFGENVFAGDGTRKEFAKTMTDTSVIKIPTEVFKNLVTENSNFANEVMKIVLLRLQLLEQRMQSFIFDKAKKRIMDFIKKTGRLRGIKIGLDEILINHGMSHKEIAHLTDTSRQTVARVLGELKREKLIHFSDRRPNKILLKNGLSIA